MPIVRIPYGNALPTAQTDYTRQNTLIETGFLQVNKPIWEDAANNIVQGAVFQIGGTVYHCTAATAIVGIASDYIKLTPSGDGSTVAPTYVADLTGVTWNSAYNGYYDVSGNAYVFDEMAAFRAGETTALNTKLWKAIYNSDLNFIKGTMQIALTEYTTTTVPAIATGSWCEINGDKYYATANIAIGGATANDNWYDILLTPVNNTFTVSFIARNTGVWSDSKQGLYSGNNRVVACVYRDGSGNFINKNILNIANRDCTIKIELGDWNMDTTNEITVAHGLTFSNIRSISGLVRDDSNTYRYSIGGADNNGAIQIWFVANAIGDFSIDATTIHIRRLSAGMFDSADFDATTYNRGWITITCEV